MRKIATQQIALGRRLIFNLTVTAGKVATTYNQTTPMTVQWRGGNR